MIYEEYRVNEEAGALNDITDLMRITLRKDQSKIEHLSKFMLNWETVLAGLKEPPPDHQLQVMFYEQVRHVPAIATDIAIYERAEAGSPERSYRFLISAVRRVLQKVKREKNRKDIISSMDSMTNTGNIAPVQGKGGKGKGKGKNAKGGKGERGKGKPADNNCWAWMKDQTCPRGATCPHDHPEINGWKFVAGAKAKAKPKNKGKSGAPKGKGKGKGNKEGKGRENTVAAVNESAKPNPKAKAKSAKAVEEGVPSSGN